MIDNQPARQQPFADSVELVRNEYQRRRDDAAVATFITSLRNSANIYIDEVFLEQLAQATAKASSPP